ncbi:hypothetical protein C2E20_2120 [Micractinium conductrix]|uniref:Uncharacterized protein n=1 Tax=Micractinium conductrix TaxID=554055 RepID=A0A2P6VKN0_9CHLO|nr:hypothetical protein C2E20_2120 [Micractinium conductrix]|eukprot:PSC74661.1 hypothetical protein C2E20_2120 [Micractinium conductrix]
MPTSSATESGFTGLYPPALRLELSAAGPVVPFLDISILPAADDGCCPVTTQLYDKRRRPEFASVQIVRFPHIASNLSVRCKYNISIGQFHRPSTGG